MIRQRQYESYTVVGFDAGDLQYLFKPDVWLLSADYSELCSTEATTLECEFEREGDKQNQQQK